MTNKIILALLLAPEKVAAGFFTANKHAQRSLWSSFKQDFLRTYEPNEDATRFGIFVDNLKIIDARNAADTATHGITKFADLTASEFKGRHAKLALGPGKRAAGGSVAWARSQQQPRLRGLSTGRAFTPPP